MIRKAVQKLHAYVPGEQPKDPRVIKLNTNENPYPPSTRVRAALRRMDPDALRLYPDPVCAPLRRQIAALHGCAPEQVLVGNGSDEVLALCARAFAERSGTIGYFDISYSLYPVLAGIEAIRRRPVALGPGFTWRMPRGYRADLFFLTHPNAPTGMTYPRAALERFCRSFAGVVLIDEAYVDFADGDCADLALSRPNVLVARTLSKSYSLAGLRLGYALGPAPLIEALHKIKDSYNVSRLAQEIAAAALADQRHMRRNAERIRATRARAARDLADRGFDVSPSQTNFLWVRPPAELPAAGLFQALRERKIFVRYFPGPATGSHLRITIGTDAQMRALLKAVDAIRSSAV